MDYICILLAKRLCTRTSILGRRRIRIEFYRASRSVGNENHRRVPEKARKESVCPLPGIYVFFVNEYFCMIRAGRSSGFCVAETD